MSEEQSSDGTRLLTQAAYDRLNRLKDSTDARQRVTRLAYDGQDRITSVCGANASAVATTVAYGHDSAGRITRVTYPSGRVLSITRVGGLPTDMALAPSASSVAAPVLTQIHFSPFGNVQTGSGSSPMARCPTRGCTTCRVASCATPWVCTRGT